MHDYLERCCRLCHCANTSCDIKHCCSWNNVYFREHFKQILMLLCLLHDKFLVLKAYKLLDTTRNLQFLFKTMFQLTLTAMVNPC